MTADDHDGLVELADAIGAVREQLIAAQAAGRRVVAGQALTFSLGKVSIEFSGEIKKTAEAGGGVQFWVVTADAKADRSRTSTHKVKIELMPLDRAGEPFKVADGVAGPPSR